ncbi:hypothetical protein diail_1671 [Diaporthe ilicicola]|nr:hypothetical protein diail_1671 [Diaporthe ilicicola]
MCYELNYHFSEHDVRPTITYSGLQTSVELVNPYATPAPCCKQDAMISSYFVCPFGHGCCYYYTKTVKCTAADALKPNCGSLTPYHIYEEKLSVLKAKGWLPLGGLDQGIQERGAVFPPHHEAVLKMGEELDGLAEELEVLVDEFFKLKDTHEALSSGWRCDAHDTCTRVLQHHECREFAITEELRAIDEDLAEMEKDIVALEIRFVIRRLRFDATADGYTGDCDMDRVSLL